MKKVLELETQKSSNLRRMVLINDRSNHKPTSKITLNKNAIKFKLNIEREINIQLQSRVSSESIG